MIAMIMPMTEKKTIPINIHFQLAGILSVSPYDARAAWREAART